MATPPTDVISSALALPARDRARLAHELLLSLDEPADAGAAEAWVSELERRSKDVRAGEVKSEEWADVRARLADRWTGK
jgi:putative addiction module component (TIGR02574 family)